MLKGSKGLSPEITFPIFFSSFHLENLLHRFSSQSPGECYGTVFQTRVVSHVVGICMYVYYISICLVIIFNINSYGCVCVTVYILQM